MEEMMNEEVMATENETTEVMPVTDSTEESSSGSMLAKAVIVGVCGLVAGAAAFGAKKLKQHNRKKTIEQLRSEGWIVEEPVEDLVSDEEFEEDFHEGEAPEEAEG